MAAVLAVVVIFGAAFGGGLLLGGGIGSGPDRANLSSLDDGWTPPAPPSAVPTATRPAPVASPVNGTWDLDMYNEQAVRWQDPDTTACEAAAAMIMLNTGSLWSIYTPEPGQPVPKRPDAWEVNTSYVTQEEILAYERQSGTMDLASPGADAHGWRNALNLYGWHDDHSGVYADRSYDSLDAAAAATVHALAVYRKPVGVLGWAGDHAQVITGYRVTGLDPRSGSSNFSVEGVYLTDPLRADGFRDTYVSMADWLSGSKLLRFTPYRMTNSPKVDPIDGVAGNAEWIGKWVLVVPEA